MKESPAKNSDIYRKSDTASHFDDMNQASSSMSSSAKGKEGKTMKGRSKEEKHSQCFEPDAPLPDIISCIEQQHNVLICMRGVPGSGKSHLARQLLTHGVNGQVFSTDDLFNTSKGVYKYDASKVAEYHAQNINNVTNAFGQRVSPIIVDNTNVFPAHMKPYTDLAVKNGYEIYFVEPDTEWKFNADECFRRNSHGVPIEFVQRMLDKYENKVSLQLLIHPIKLRITTQDYDYDTAASRAPDQPATGAPALFRPSQAATTDVEASATTQVKLPVELGSGSVGRKNRKK